MDQKKLSTVFNEEFNKRLSLKVFYVCLAILLCSALAMGITLYYLNLGTAANVLSGKELLWGNVCGRVFLTILISAIMVVLFLLAFAVFMGGCAVIAEKKRRKKLVESVGSVQEVDSGMTPMQAVDENVMGIPRNYEIQSKSGSAVSPPLSILNIQINNNNNAIIEEVYPPVSSESQQEDADKAKLNINDNLLKKFFNRAFLENRYQSFVDRLKSVEGEYCKRDYGRVGCLVYKSPVLSSSARDKYSRNKKSEKVLCFSAFIKDFFSALGISSASTDLWYYEADTAKVEEKFYDLLCENDKNMT